MTVKQIEKQNQRLKAEVRRLKKKLEAIKKAPVESDHIDGIRPPTVSEQEYHDIMKKTAGALKGKLPKNLVAWQRKTRAEWDGRYEGSARHKRRS